MRIEDYYIQKIDDAGYEDIAKFILSDNEISNEEKLELCIQLFELDHKTEPLKVCKQLYTQLEYNEKNNLWELYRKYLASRKMGPKRLILESILKDFVNDDEFIKETLVYTFGNVKYQKDLENFIKITEGLSEELRNELKTIITEFIAKVKLG